MKIKLFCSKEITCMLKASNNHFDDKSKIKPLKIRHFRNSKSAKIAKKIWKKKTASVLEGTACAKHYKNYTK